MEGGSKSTNTPVLKIGSDPTHLVPFVEARQIWGGMS